MSLAAIEGQRPDTLYVSTGGGWSPATDEAIRDLASAPTPGLWQQPTTIGRVTSTLIAFAPSPRKRARGMRGCDRAPMTGTRI